MATAAIAYLDLLGFKSAAGKGAEFAIQLLQDYYDAVNTALGDARQPCPPGCEQLRERNLITSFQHFLPLSDSVFIVSADPSLLVFQLSSFLAACFGQRMNAFAHPRDPDQPDKVIDDATEVTETVICRGEDGKPIVRKETTHWLPVLFRGGITYGEFHLLRNAAIVDKVRQETRNLAGRDVVEAVGLEERMRESPVVKGPRVLCTDAFVSQLSQDARAFVAECLEDRSCQEVYWPMAYFETEPSVTRGIQNGLVEPLQAALNLWKTYMRKEPRTARHYEGFARLLVRSAMRKYPDGSVQIQAAAERIVADTCLLKSLLT
ncbi:MAG: hypothetical protein BWX88_05032 [Planctomycetes bacterium ADurb.Bin126]|nr:MAG: hypothetical protein BWX88_05032 [Planctomycetes bacterium ADurb.Bin126]